MGAISPGEQETGFNAHVVKPVDPDALRKLLTSLELVHKVNTPLVFAS
jgi:hypothetical protein